MTGVTNGSSGPLLNVGNATVSLSDVQQIGDRRLLELTWLAPRPDQHCPDSIDQDHRYPD